MDNRTNDFLKSEEAKTMLDYISPIYGSAYIALSILDSIGLSMDEVKKNVDEYLLQVVPQTATWSLSYWEQEYGLAVQESLSFQQRRDRILVQMKNRVSMNPFRIAEIASAASGVKVDVVENVAKNTFRLIVSALSENGIYYKTMVNSINSVKPAHLIYEIVYQQGSICDYNNVSVTQKAAIFTLHQYN